MAFARVIMVLTEGLSRPSRRRTRASNMTMMIRAESDAWPLAKEKGHLGDETLVAQMVLGDSASCEGRTDSKQ
jgi:hypothetical protein